MPVSLELHDTVVQLLDLLSWSSCKGETGNAMAFVPESDKAWKMAQVILLLPGELIIETADADRFDVRSVHLGGDSQTLQRYYNHSISKCIAPNAYLHALEHIFCSTEVVRESVDVQATSVHCPAALLGNRRGESFNTTDRSIVVRLCDS